MSGAPELVLSLVNGCEAAARRRVAEAFLAQWPHPAKLLYVVHRTLYRAAWASGLRADDIDAECLYGVAIAATKYDPAKGDFHGYAIQWMRAALGYSVRRWLRAKARQFCILPTDHGDAESEAAMVPARPEADPDAADEAASLLRVLDDRRRRAVEMHYGRRATFCEIAAELGVCNSRAKQLCDGGLAALRRQAKRRAAT